MNCFASGFCGGNPNPLLTTFGKTINCQWWERDTPTFGTFLTDALEYEVGL